MSVLIYTNSISNNTSKRHLPNIIIMPVVLLIFRFEIGQQYAVVINGHIQRQNGIVVQAHKNSDGEEIRTDQILSKDRPVPSRSLEPTVQIQVQSLIKPATRNQPVQAVAPIIYSFGQTDFSNKPYANTSFGGLPSNNKNNQHNSKKYNNKRISWGRGDLDYEDDNFADILG